MAEFILEIGFEEMPARFGKALTRELGELAASLLAEAGLGHGQARTSFTPRRLVLHVPGLQEAQPRTEEVVTGPPMRVAFDDSGAPTKAAQGFAKGQGVDVADLFAQATDKGEYVAARVERGGRTALEILPELCGKAVQSLSFPKKMRWGSGSFAFGRPLRWLLALLDGKVVEFSVGNTASGRATFGHRIHGPGPWDVASAPDYFQVMRESCGVVLDMEERRRIIRERGDELAKEAGGRIIWNESLLDEVVNLVERPVPVLGRFDESFLEVPREALLTCMESHQKSFGVENAEGEPMPYFLCTLNIVSKDMELVRKGWERVLKARLEDARFFWRNDLKADFAYWLDKLEHVTFIGPLGTMADKSRRIERLCGILAKASDPALEADAARAGRLCKADLVSEMVYEFDTLQGIMGGIYAARKGESEAVARAVYEHYLPTGPDSDAPATLVGRLVSLADKADNLAGCFGLGMIPTGAADPNALRRQILGICRIMLDSGLRLSLAELLAQAQAGYQGVQWKLAPEEALDKLKEFAGQRLRAYFTGQGFATRLVDAALGAGFDDVWAVGARLSALAAFAEADGFEQAVLTFKRAANIIRKQADEMDLSGKVDEAALAEEQEKALAAKLAEVAPVFEDKWAKDDFPALFELLGELRPFVDGFFDHVMVMCEDEALKVNRLNLLHGLVDMLGRLADFPALQV